MIIISPPLHNTQQSSIRKCLYLWLISFLKHELMTEISQLMSFKIKNSYAILFAFKNSYLIFTQHSERIDITSITKYFLI